MQQIGVGRGARDHTSRIFEILRSETNKMNIYKIKKKETGRTNIIHVT